MVSLRQWASMIEHVHAASPAGAFPDREAADSGESALGEFVVREAQRLLQPEGEVAIGGGGGQG